MRSADVVGRTITAVRQQRFWDASVRAWRIDVVGFELDNGAFISLNGMDDGIGTYVHAEVRRTS